MTAATTRIDGACLIDAAGRAVPVWLRIAAGRLSAVSDTPLEPVAGEAVIDASGELVAPGLVNAHTHSTLSATRGTTDRMDHPTFMWTNQANTFGRSAEEIEAVTTLGAADMLRHGITGAVDHVPEQNATLEGIAPIAAAWQQSGMRAAMALRIFDGAYGDIGDGGYASGESPLKPMPAADLLALCDEAIHRWHRPDAGIKVYPGPSNSERCSDALLAGAHALAERHGTGFHAHLLETRVQREASLASRGITPVERLQRLGALSHRTSFAHCVWCDEGDIARFADAGAVVVHNPHSNAKLGVGLMPLAAMLEAGCTVALGTDGAATNDTLDIHETMALALLMQRATGTLERSRWPTARDALAMATEGGAAALMERGETGAIRPGAWADLVFYDRSGAALSPPNDLREQLVFAERGRSVRRVLVAGRTLYADGAFSTLDVEGARAIAEAMRRRRR